MKGFSRFLPIVAIAIILAAMLTFAGLMSPAVTTELGITVLTAGSILEAGASHVPILAQGASSFIVMMDSMITPAVGATALTLDKAAALTFGIGALFLAASIWSRGSVYPHTGNMTRGLPGSQFSSRSLVPASHGALAGGD